MAAKRKPVSTRTRFEVFKRDKFTCQYCGGKPPAVVLHLDHITPVSKRGTNDLHNLVTSCKDCNLGKSDVPLTDTRPTPGAATILELREAREQLEAYQAYLMEERAQREAAIEVIIRELDKRLGVVPDDRTKASLRTILRELPYPEVLDAVDITESREIYRYPGLKYFFGVCWTKIKNNRVNLEQHPAADHSEMN